MKTRLGFALLVLLVLLLTGCGAASNLTMDQPAAEPFPDAANRNDRLGAPDAFGEAEAPSEPIEEFDSDEGGRGAFSGQAVAVERLVIRNANLTVVVDDPAQSVAEISRMAEEMGGFVVSSQVFQTTYRDSGVTANEGQITVRVPAEMLDQALEQIKAPAIEVRNENVSGEDVTREYTDLNSRLRNLEDVEARLQEILSRADDSEDVLNIFQDLRQVGEEIEVLKGQIQYFEEAAALSAISVNLIPDAAAQPLRIGNWQPEGTAKDAVEDLFAGLQFLGDLLIRFAICVLPFLIIFGLPLFFVGRSLVRRSRGSKEQQAPDAGAETPAS